MLKQKHRQCFCCPCKKCTLQGLSARPRAPPARRRTRLLGAGNTGPVSDQLWLRAEPCSLSPCRCYPKRLQAMRTNRLWQVLAQLDDHSQSPPNVELPALFGKSLQGIASIVQNQSGMVLPPACRLLASLTHLQCIRFVLVHLNQG
jgi:hypothetical protein